MLHPLEHDSWTTRARLTAAAIGLTAALTNFDVTAVVVALPTIGRALDVPVTDWAWIIDVYSLGFTATLLVAGALADRFGRRRILLAGNAGFLVASFACGLAWSSPVFLAARAAQGVAAAFLVTGGFASIASAFPKAEMRARAFGMAGAASGVAMALGPSLGGAIATGLGWRWIFLVNLPCCLLIAMTLPRMVAEAHGGTERAVDWPGVVIITAALGLLIEAILEARQGLLKASLALALGTTLATWFLVRQTRQAQPMLDPRVFASRPMLGVAALLISVSVSYWAVLVYLPLYLAAAFGWTTEAVGLAMLAATLPMLLVPPVGGWLARRVGWRMLFSMALSSLAMGGFTLCLSTLTDPPAYLLAFAGMALIGAGAALSHPQLSGAVITLAPPEAGGMASALTVIVRQAGFALGVAILGALTPAGLKVGGFVWVFGAAAGATVCGVAAGLFMLPPQKDKNVL